MRRTTAALFGLALASAVLIFVFHMQQSPEWQQLLLISPSAGALVTFALDLRSRSMPPLEGLRRDLSLVDLVAQPGEISRRLVLADIYVERRLRVLSLSSAPQMAPELAARVSVGEEFLLEGRLQGRGVYVVLGGPGSGKTLLLRHLALTLLERGAGRRGRPVPLLLSLRDHRADILDGVDLVKALHSSRWYDDKATSWIARKLATGRCVVFLDGLDEVTDDDMQTRATDWIRKQIGAFPECVFVITSRPSGYARNPLHGAAVLELKDFDSDQIREYLAKWQQIASSPRAADRTGVGLLGQLDSQPWLNVIAANPLLLSMIVTVFQNRVRLPGTVAAVYEEASLTLLHERQAAKQLWGNVAPQLKEAVARELALAMMQERTFEISAQDAARFVRSVIRRASLDHEVTTDDVLQELSRNGLLIARGADRYAFLFLGFQEYFAAAALRRRGGGWEELVDRVDDPWWHETTVLWATLGDASRVVEACLASDTDRALDLAEECADVTPSLDPDLRYALEARLEQRRRRGELRATSPSRVLISFVTDMYGTADARGEPGATPSVDLLALAEQMRQRRIQSALDLYVAALGSTVPAPRVGDVMKRYLLSANGLGAAADNPAGPWPDCLREQVRGKGSHALAALLPLLADKADIRDLILDAVTGDPELRAASATFLRAQPGQDLREAWEAAAQEWLRRRFWLLSELTRLCRLTLVDSALTNAIEALSDLEYAEARELYHELDLATRALQALKEYTAGGPFAAREHALISAQRLAERLSEDIRLAPTALTVEGFEPLAVMLRELADGAYHALLDANPPLPSLSLAISPSTRVGNLITVQIKVANGADRAPLESPTLTVESKAPDFEPGEQVFALPSRLHGGESHIVLVKLPMVGIQLQPAYSVFFELPVTLTYNKRATAEAHMHAVELPIHVGPDTFAEIANPYVAGANGVPVTGENMFFGRDELIDRIRNRIGSTPGPVGGVALFGQRRSGKSSIRLHLVKRLRERDGVPVADIGNIGELSPGGDLNRLLALIMWRILEAADEEVRRLRPDVPLLPAGLRREEFLASPDPVHDAAQIFAAHRLAAAGLPAPAVCIDEFQYINGWIKDGLVPAAFMQSFKAIVERDLFHLVIVGQSDLERLVHDDPNVFGVFSTERVSHLDEASALRLIHEPAAIRDRSQRRSRFLERAADRVVELSGANAFYIQRLCNELIEYMNEQHAPFVTEADVDVVAEQFLATLEEADFDNLESHGRDGFSKAEYREVLLAVARASEAGKATAEAVAERCDGADLSEILRDLVDHQVLRYEMGAYRIRVGIYRLWLLDSMGAS